MTRAIRVACLVVVAACARRDAPPATQIVEVTSGDFYFTAPDSIAAGRTEFRMHNVAGRHVLAISRLDSGHTLADAMAIPDSVDLPRWIVDLGGPISADSVGTTSAVLDLVPGRYVLLCYFGGTDHVAHYLKGMVKEIAVTGSAAAPAEPPVADVVVDVTDYDFVLSQPLTAGRRTIRFVNSSPQAHEIIIQRLNPGAHLADWRRAREGTGPVPLKPAGGIGGLGRGQSVTMIMDVTPGDYLWVCYFSDITDDRSHLEHGMVREIHID